MQFPVPPPTTRNFLQEEGVQLPPEPAQPGFFQQVGQTLRDSARAGALERVGEAGAVLGAGAATLGGQALRRVGGAVRDGAVRTLDWEQGYLWRAADAAGKVILNPLSWRQNAATQALRTPLLAEEAAVGGAVAAETFGFAGAGAAAAEGAELGMFGGLPEHWSAQVWAQQLVSPSPSVAVTRHMAKTTSWTHAR